MIIESIPQIVSRVILAKLQKTLVFETLFNEDYSGDVASGNSVAVVGIDSATVKPYTRNNPITYETIEDEALELPIDQEYYYAVRVDDLDKVQSNPDLIAAVALDAVYQVAAHIDKDLGEVLDAGAEIDVMGSDETPVQLTSSNILQVMARISRLLDEANVPRGGRGIVLPPWGVEKLVLAGADIKTENAAAFDNGWIGRVSGLDVRMSTACPSVSDATSVLAGSNIGATLAMQVQKTEALRLQGYFADAVRGLICYGRVITRPATIARLVCVEGEEAE